MNARKVLFENNHVKISFEKGDKNLNTVLCFTGVGHSLGGIDFQKEEFNKLNFDLGNKIWITDKNRSWGNALDFAKVFKVVSPFLSGKTFSLGNSMGGFLAIISTYFFKVDVSVSFSPQFSVHPSIVPQEKRWEGYRNNISKWKFSSLNKYFNNSTKYYLFYGGHWLEYIHWSNINTKKNIQNLIFRNWDHNVSQNLKKDMVLHELIYQCFEKKNALEFLRKRYNGQIFRLIS